MSLNTAEVLHDTPTLTLVPPLEKAEHHPLSFPGREIIVLALILAILQIADGILTGIGIYHLGIEMEGNPLLRFLMYYCGTIPTLILVKGGALGIIALLTTLSGAVSWLALAMRGMVALYTLFAVIPWSAILYGYFS